MEHILPIKTQLGEGPVWMPDEQALYWLDIEGFKIHRFIPKTNTDETFVTPNLIGCIAPTESGGFLFASQNGIVEGILSNQQMNILRTVTHPEKPQNRYNDGKCSPEGRFWFGSLNLQKHQNQAALYTLDNCGCRRVIDGATNSNGLAWNPDGNTFYWIDTPTRRIEGFDYDKTHGTLSNRRTIFHFPVDVEWGRPDGMTVDSEGAIWVAHWGGSRVTQWRADTGEIIRIMPLPVENVTSVTFGGIDMKTLFITTANSGVFAEKMNVPGLPVSRFRNIASS
ncbi:MAG: SMP-30/gluconolactonase/LRE family protein [Thermoguttaceae bacterium]